jgi:hypothetical protein
MIELLEFMDALRKWRLTAFHSFMGRIMPICHGFGEQSMKQSRRSGWPGEEDRDRKEGTVASGKCEYEWYLSRQ